MQNEVKYKLLMLITHHVYMIGLRGIAREGTWVNAPRHGLKKF